MKPKLLHITESFGGGVYTFLVELCNALSDKYDITIAYSLRSETPENFSVEFNENIKFHAMQYGCRSPHPIKDTKYYFEIKKLIKQLNPDIVHLHSSKAGFAGRLAANSSKSKVFYTPHGFSFLMQNIPSWKRNVFLTLEKIGAKTNSTSIGVSQSEGEFSKKFTPNATYVNNGVVIPHFDTSKEKFTDLNSLKYGTMSRIAAAKNPSLFNDIANKLSEKQFIWIGGGDRESELTAKNINKTGWIPREKAVKLLDTEIDVFLLTSLWEGLPIALLEAMGMGKICIALDIPGISEVVEHGKTGFIVKSLEEYIDIIGKIEAGEYDLKEMSKLAHEYVVKNFSAKDMCKKYDMLYMQAIKTK